MKHLETIGSVDLFLDEASRDIIVATKTEIGTITASLTAEKACLLGVALIRESGKRYVFKQREQPPVAAPPQQEEESNDTESNGSNGVGGRAMPDPDDDREPICLSGGTGRGSIPRRDIPGVEGGGPRGSNGPSAGKP